MRLQLVVTLAASVILSAASELNRDAVDFGMIMLAPSFGVDVDAQNFGRSNQDGTTSQERE